MKRTVGFDDEVFALGKLDFQLATKLWLLILGLHHDSLDAFDESAFETVLLLLHSSNFEVDFLCAQRGISG